MEGNVSLAPTLSLDQATKRTWPVLILGAGPAGALAAHEIARRGVSVLLVDRSAFPRTKVCGCCLNGVALAVLAAVGLESLTTHLHAIPLHEVLLHAGRHTAQIRLPSGVALSREALDTALIQAAIHAGAEFLPGTHAIPKGVMGSETLRQIKLRQESYSGEVSTSILLDATGLTSAGSMGWPGSRVGAGTILDKDESYCPLGQIHLHCGKGGYVGIVRLEDGRLDVACAFEVQAMRLAHGPANLARRILMECGVKVPDGLAHARWRGTLPLTRVAREIAGHRLFVLGDAAGYVEPFTGEGIAWALTSALAVASLACQPWSPKLAHRWRQRQRFLRRGQIFCQGVAWLLRYPVCSKAMTLVLSRWPKLAEPIVRSLNHSRLSLSPEVIVR